MSEQNISQEFRLKNIDETRNYFLKEIEQNKLMSEKHKKVCTNLKYIEHFLRGRKFIGIHRKPNGKTKRATAMIYAVCDVKQRFTKEATNCYINAKKCI